MTDHGMEVCRGARLQIAAVSGRSLRVADESRILEAEQSLTAMLVMSNLEGKRFVDIGSVGGLFGLAAR